MHAHAHAIPQSCGSTSAPHNVAKMNIERMNSPKSCGLTLASSSGNNSHPMLQSLSDLFVDDDEEGLAIFGSDALSAMGQSNHSSHHNRHNHLNNHQSPVKASGSPRRKNSHHHSSNNSNGNNGSTSNQASPRKHDNNAVSAPNQWQGSCQSFAGDGEDLFLSLNNVSISELHSSFSDVVNRDGTPKKQIKNKVCSATLKEEMELLTRMRKKMAKSADHKPFSNLPKSAHGKVFVEHRQRARANSSVRTDEQQPASASDIPILPIPSEAMFESPCKNRRPVLSKNISDLTMSPLTTCSLHSDLDNDSEQAKEDVSPRRPVRTNEAIGRRCRSEKSNHLEKDATTKDFSTGRRSMDRFDSSSPAKSASILRRPTRQKSKDGLVGTSDLRIARSGDSSRNPIASDEMSHEEVFVLAPSVPKTCDFEHLKTSMVFPQQAGLGAPEPPTAGLTISCAPLDDLPDAAPKKPARACSPTRDSAEGPRQQQELKDSVSAGASTMTVRKVAVKSKSKRKVHQVKRSSSRHLKESDCDEQKQPRHNKNNSMSSAEESRVIRRSSSKGKSRSRSRSKSRSRSSNTPCGDETQASPSKSPRSRSGSSSSGKSPQHVKQQSARRLGSASPARRDGISQDRSSSRRQIKKMVSVMNFHYKPNVDECQVVNSTSPRRIRKIYQSSQSCKHFDAKNDKEIALPSVKDYFAPNDTTAATTSSTKMSAPLSQNEIDRPPVTDFQSKNGKMPSSRHLVAKESSQTSPRKSPKATVRSSASCRELNFETNKDVPPVSPRKARAKIFQSSSSCRALNFKQSDTTLDVAPITPRKIQPVFRSSASCRELNFKSADEHKDVAPCSPRHRRTARAASTSTNNGAVPPPPPSSSRPTILKKSGSCRDLNFKTDNKDVMPRRCPQPAS